MEARQDERANRGSKERIKTQQVYTLYHSTRDRRYGYHYCLAAKIVGDTKLEKNICFIRFILTSSGVSMTLS